jgi:hypothetical protein
MESWTGNEIVDQWFLSNPKIEEQMIEIETKYLAPSAPLQDSE